MTSEPARNPFSIAPPPSYVPPAVAWMPELHRALVTFGLAALPAASGESAASAEWAESAESAASATHATPAAPTAQAAATPQDWSGSERRGPTRARNVTRPPFRSKAAAPTPAVPAAIPVDKAERAESARQKTGTDDEWASF